MWFMKVEWKKSIHFNILLRFYIFFKDSIQWKLMYDKLKNEKYMDKLKLLYLAVNSIESLLKSIYLLQNNQIKDSQLKSILKYKFSHKITNIKINGLSADAQKWIQRIQDFYNNNYRYWIDAFVNWYEVMWIWSNKSKKDVDNFYKIVWRILNICENVYVQLNSFFVKLLVEYYWEVSWKMIYKIISSPKSKMYLAQGHYDKFINNYLK